MIFFFFILLTLCSSSEFQKSLFQECNVEKAKHQLFNTHTSESHLYQYFIKYVLENDLNEAIPHLIAAKDSVYFPYIYAYNSYFTKLFPCDYEKIADLYLPKAQEIHHKYLISKSQFKKKKLLKEVESQESIKKSLDHISNLISAGDQKAEKAFLKILESGAVEPVHYEETLKALAQKGEARAMAMLGEMYYEGRGVEKCLDSAMHYFTEGANKKNPACFNAMGLIYMTNKDYDAAKLNFDEAYVRGYPDTGYHLYHYYKTRYNTNDIGLFYLINSANRGYLAALYEYSLILYKEKNLRNSVMYLSAICDYGAEITDGLDIAEKLYFDERIDECLIQLIFTAELGSTNAMANILYLLNHKRNKLKSAYFNEQARIDQFIIRYNKLLTNMGYKTSLVSLGDCYFYGIGTERNYEDAYVFYLSSVLHKQAEGFYSLCYLYEHGLGVDVNYSKALNYLYKIEKYEPKMYLLVWYLTVKLCLKILIFEKTFVSVLCCVLTIVLIGIYRFGSRKKTFVVNDNRDNNLLD